MCAGVSLVGRAYAAGEPPQILPSNKPVKRLLSVSVKTSNMTSRAWLSRDVDGCPFGDQPIARPSKL